MPCTTFFFNGKNYPKPTPTKYRSQIGIYVKKEQPDNLPIAHLHITNQSSLQHQFYFYFFFSNQVPPISAILKLCHKNPIFIT